MVAKVLIENLAPQRTVSEVTTLLTPYEPIAWIFIELDSNTGRPWGYAYFALASEEQAKALVEHSTNRELDGGNDGKPLRFRIVESAPDNYIDKTPLLKSPAQYIFSQSRLVVNDIPAGSVVLLDNVVKAELEISASIEIQDLIPGKYKLSVKNSQTTIFQQDIEILPLETVEVSISSMANIIKEEIDNTVSPFKTTLESTGKKSRFGLWVGGFLIIAISLGAYYYFYLMPKSVDNTVVVKPAPPIPEGMVYVPAERFVMGRNSSKDPVGFEIPAHATEVKEEFFLDKTEVTNKQYKEFVDATGHDAPPNWKGKIPPQEILDLPVVFVSWQDAFEYCQWRKYKGRACRLPREKEWELAARGPNGNIYPWGNEWKDGLANANKITNKILPVGKNASNKSYFGVLDMVGNVWEWVYDDLQIYELSKAPPQPGVKVIRGGAFDSDPEEATGSYRGFLIPNKREYDRTGFRCACDVIRE
ncbi:MAG: SUMF1/EgtB/PvdO family nonheme iron enzyme [Acidobacteria bacterium]|nr:SUMF1/EgtB/PvdO family nonheme iron enzyme [Acidobacteriota bacterium]